MAEHFASSASNCKDRPNRLFIEDALDDDNSVARLSSKTMDELQLFCGDTVKLKGKKRRETICIVLSDDSCRDDRIRINHVVQKNLCAHLGDGIVIEGCQHVQYGTRVHVLPIDDTMKDSSGNLLQDYLQPYFRDAFRPVCVNDMFTVQVGMHCVEFKIIETEPSPYCIVAPETVICCEGAPIERQLEETSIDEIDFDSIGGLEDVKQSLKEFIQYPLQHEEIYHRFGMEPPRGVLLYGPSGCGNYFLLYLKS